MFPSKVFSILFCLALLTSCIGLGDTKQCTVTANGEAMYSRFYNLWAENTAVKDGIPTAKTRVMSESEKSEAQDCLKKADELNNCSAIHVLELFYRFGVGDELGIKKDTAVADKYLERKKLACSAGLTHHSSGTPNGAP